jgi:hypothetical protein
MWEQRLEETHSSLSHLRAVPLSRFDPVRDLFVHAKDVFVEANDGPLAPLHCWLTNRKNDPAAINRAIRIPTTSEATQCRRSMGFDPAPFCAAPMPNQKRRLPIDLIPRYSQNGLGLHRRQGRYPSSADGIQRSSGARLRPRHQLISAFRKSAGACPGQQSLQPPAARMEAPQARNRLQSQSRQQQPLPAQH